jgi:peptidoglycan/xylan/chitin deacetylase (PgdA/CDA1 family)
VRALRQIVKQTLASPPAWRMSAPLRKRRSFVLTYHRIGTPAEVLNHADVEEFRRQMMWLRRYCLPIGPADLKEPGDPADPRPRVLVTFDDGYRDYYELAYPILHGLRIPAVNFISTDYADTGRLFWWDVVDLAGHRTSRKRVTLPWPPHTTYDVNDTTRMTLLRACKYVIACAPDVDRDRLVGEACEMFAVDPSSIDAPRQVMTWHQIRSSMELTHYGGHTHTHVRVSRVDPAILEREVRTCRDRLLAETGIAPSLFAYPIGDGSDEARAILPRFGFDTAFTVHKGYLEPPVDWLNVPRFTGPPTVGDLAWIAMGQARGDAPGARARS